MNRLSVGQRAQIIAHLTEGCSLRTTARLTGHDVNTVMWLGAEIGRLVKAYQDQTLRELQCATIQCDETWSFVYAKERNVAKVKAKGKTNIGDCYTWVAMDPDTKLAVCWHVGRREPADAQVFMNDLQSRVVRRIQLSTDGFSTYVPAIQEAFGTEVDYGWLVKNFGQALDRDKRVEAKYSPPPLKSMRGSRVIGDPDPALISTNIVERHNLSIRMSLRRCTRLTNGFSKKFENHEAALALYFMNYNFCRIHETIRCTPAMEAGISDHVWSHEEVAQLLD